MFSEAFQLTGDAAESLPVIDSAGLEMLRRLLQEKSGLVFEGAHIETLRHKLIAKLEAHRMRSLSDYYFFLRYSSAGREEFERLVEALTINETYFFRNPRQFEFFENRILPWAMETRLQRAGGSLKFWSAGCSSGEEPYSIAMCVTDAIAASGQPERWSPRVLATDINREMLKAARAGLYKEWALRRMPPGKRLRYIQPRENDEFTVAPEIKAIVNFDRRNLLSPGPSGDPTDLDVIFCRNVLIYFDNSDIAKVVQRFYDCLRPGAYLFLGHSESLHHITGAFDVVLEPGVVVYRKGED